MIPETNQTQFLEFVGEDSNDYRIRSGSDVESLPKTVRQPEFPSVGRSETLSRAARYLRWAVIGLLPAGLGTIVFAPLAARAASRELQTSEEPQNQRRALVILGLAVLLLLAALPLAYLFLLHW